jgi:hypothetical protein
MMAIHVHEMMDTSQIPAIAEPWFLAFNADVERRPVMLPADLAKAGGAISEAAKKHAQTAGPAVRERRRAPTASRN